MTDQAREPSSGGRLAVTLVCLALALAAGGLTGLFVHRSEDAPSANFTVPSPEMILLTNQPGASVTYSILYYQSSVTVPGETQFGPADSVAPLDTRRMIFQIHMRPYVRRLRFAILLNHDAAMTEPTAIKGVGYIDNTVPGGVEQSSCADLLSFSTAQVLSGIVTVDSTGDTTIDLVGGVPGYVRYPSNGDRTPVNVIQMLPSASDVAAPGPKTCTVNLINWEQVGGIYWQTPTIGSGQVSIGSVPAGQYIESSNPPPIDAQSLSWKLDGPADVSYTLFNSNSQSSHAQWLFWAGIAAALGATLLVEFVKGITETVWLIRHRDDKRATAGQPVPQAVPSPQDGIPIAERRNQRWPAFVTGLVSGILLGRRGWHRSN